MKLNNETIEILKNFSSINSGIMIREGSVIATVSQQKNILAEATVEDVFPVSFCIFDINNFLSVISLYKDGAELEFDGNNNVLISGLNGRSKVRYRFASETTIVVAPEKRPVLPSVDIKFTLSNSDLEWIKKTSAVLGSPNISVVSDGETVSLVASDVLNSSAHTMNLTVEDIHPQGIVYNMVFKTENLKVLPGKYDVEIYSKGISTFSNTERQLKYWITTEQNSKFGG